MENNGIFNIEEVEKQMIPQYKGKKFQEFVFELYEKLQFLYDIDDTEIIKENILNYQTKQLYHYCYDNKINSEEFIILEHTENPCFPMFLPLTKRALEIYKS